MKKKPKNRPWSRKGLKENTRKVLPDLTQKQELPWYIKAFDREQNYGS